MELDNLKHIWRDIGQKTLQQNDDEQIVMMLQKSSRSPISKMKKNLLRELIAVICFYCPGILYFALSSKGYWEIAALLAFVGLLFMLYYYRKNKLLRDMQCVTCEVRSNLQQQLATLQTYVRFYFISGTVLTPIAYFASALVVLFKSRALEGSIADISSLFIIGAVGIAVTAGGYFVNRWYVKKLYGQHIQKLKQLLQQTEERESELIDK